MDKHREHWLLGRALYDAITRLSGLPDEIRPDTDIDDMEDLLDEQYADVKDMMVVGEAYRPSMPAIRLVPNETDEEDDT